MVSSLTLDRKGTANANSVNTVYKIVPMILFSATANDTTVITSGRVSVYGGELSGLALAGYTSVGSATLSDVNISSGGILNLYEAMVTGVTISSGGSMNLFYATVSDVTVQSGGIMDIGRVGTATDFTILTGGSMLASDCLLTGSMSFATGAVVSMSRAELNFDIAKRTPNDCSRPLVNDITGFTGDFTCTITLSDVQSFGTYSLLGWADGFDRTLTVLNDAWDDTGITLEVDVTKNIFGADHTLRVIGSKLVLIVGESEGMDPADNGRNDTLYDKKTKQVNKAVYDMDALAVTADTKELLIDTAGTVRALDDRYNFIGNSESGTLDTADFTKIELETAAKLNFIAYSGQAAKFTVWQLVEGRDKNGAITYTMKSLQSTTLKGGYVGVSTSKKPLLLEAGTYYVSMELSNAKKAGEDGYYTVMIDDSSYATEFYTRADNSDDWDDMKTMGAGGKVAELGTLSADNFETGIVSDGWVGFSDAADYMEFKLESAAKLGFYLHATDETKFTVWQKNEKRDKNGNYTYSLKSLQSVTLKKEGVDEFWADTSGKPLILNAGMYYMSMESTNAKKGGSATYEIMLSGAEFYDRADNSDDWTDMKADGDFGLVGDVGTISGDGKLLEDWVGFGDAIDYKRFTLNKKTSFSFSVFTEDAAKFTVWRLDNKTDKKGVTTYSLKALGSMKLGAVSMGQLSLNLGAGKYYFSMESTNAKKGASCDYTVELASFVESDSLSAALTMPEADVLADVAAITFDQPDGKAAAWQSLLA